VAESEAIMPTLREALADARQAKKAVAKAPKAKQAQVLASQLAMMELLHYCDNSGYQPPRLTAQQLRKVQAWMNIHIIQAFQIKSSKVLNAFDDLIDQQYWADDATEYARQYAQLLGVLLA